MEIEKNTINVIFREGSGEVARMEFSREDNAREFAQEHPGACVVIDKRCSQEGGENVVCKN